MKKSYPKNRNQSTRVYKKKDYSGLRVNSITVLGIDTETTSKYRKLIAKCDCGNHISIYLNQVYKGREQIKSCMECRNKSYIGRFKGEKSPTYKHGKHKTSEYIAWSSMRGRCLNPKNPKYKHYGGRGIRFCPSWNDFTVFCKDMGTKPKGTTLDRIDVNGNYEPSNCRWATQKVQQNNKTNTRTITINSVTKTITEWAEISGVSNKIIRQRLDRDNMSPEEAIRPTAIKHRQTTND